MKVTRGGWLLIPVDHPERKADAVHGCGHSGLLA